MGRNRLDLDEVCSLIDSYRYKSINGERIEISISPSGNQRKISIGVSETDRQTLYFEDGEQFDESICFNILKHINSSDSIGKWKIVEPVGEQDTYSGTAETRSGNIIYLDTKKRELFDNINFSNSYIPSNRNEDMVWEEIIFLVKNILSIKNMGKVQDDDFNKIMAYLNSLDINNEKIKPGISDSSLAANIAYLKSNLLDETAARNMGLTNDVLDILETSILEKAANYLGVKKQVNNRIDLDNEIIKKKVSFALNELSNVGYFSPTADISKSAIQERMKMISKILDNKEKNELYAPFCYELIGFNFRVFRSLTASEEKIVDSYEKLEGLIGELNSNKEVGKRYEIIIDNSHDVSIVRIDSIEGRKKRIIATFEFTDKTLFSKRINDIVTKIYRTDPSLLNTTCVVRDLSNSLGRNIVKASDKKGIIFTSGRKYDEDIITIIESIQRGKETKTLCESKYNSLIEKLNQTAGTIEDVKKIAYFEFRLRMFYEQEIMNLDDLASARKKGNTPSCALFNSILDNISKHPARFEIVKPVEEEQKPNGIIEIEDAYSESLDYATDDYPSSIRVAFRSDSEIEVIISNKKGSEDLVLYDRVMSIDELNNNVLNTLIKLFAADNSIYYNIKDKIEGSDTSFLLVVGECKRSFSIVNASEDFIDKARNQINESMSIKENIITK